MSCEGGFAEYCTLYVRRSSLTPPAVHKALTGIYSAANKVYKIANLSDEEATLVEPAACAIHGLEQLDPGIGIEALVIGAGPTGLILAQLLKQNGAARVVVAANKGIKTQVARQLGAADEYVELNRTNPEAQWEQLKKENPYGFDVVVEATGSEKIANDAIHYVRRGGTLMVYGVYDSSARVHWPPSKIFGDEIRVRNGPFSPGHSADSTMPDYRLVRPDALLPSRGSLSR